MAPDTFSQSGYFFSLSHISLRAAKWLFLKLDTEEFYYNGKLHFLLDSGSNIGHHFMKTYTHISLHLDYSLISIYQLEKVPGNSSKEEMKHILC
jgi:hypothetical protein